MGSFGYLPQVICEATLHFGSKTLGVLRIEGAMAERVEEATAQIKTLSTQTFFHQFADGLAFHARAGGLEFGHDAFHHSTHVFHGR